MNTTKTIRAVDRVIDLLEDPNEPWILGYHTLEHPITKIQIWLANMPVIDTNTYPGRLRIGLIDKWRLWRATKVAIENMVIRRLEKNEELADLSTRLYKSGRVSASVKLRQAIVIVQQALSEVEGGGASTQ